MNNDANADTQTLFTGRDILAAENHLRCAKTFAAALEIAASMPATVIERVATHVKADPASLISVVTQARKPYAAR